MKSFAILTDSTQLIYVWCDNEFQEHLKHLNIVDGEGFDLIGSCQHFYSLIAASYLAITETKELYSFIESENDKLTLCFKKYDEFLYVGLVNKTSCKDQVFRVIGFLRSLIAFLFGYCGQYQLKTSSTTLKRRMWYCLNTLLVTYLSLYQTDNSFFNEGIEELQVSRDLKNACENLIKKCRQFIDAKIKKQLQFVILFAGTKLLHCQRFSHSSNLTTQTVLMILALLQSDFNPTLLQDVSLIPDQTEIPRNSFQNPDNDTIYLRTDFDYLFDNASIAPASSTHSTFEEGGNQATRRRSSDGDEGTFSPIAVQHDINVFFNEEDYSETHQCYTIPAFLFNKKKRCMPSSVCCIPVLPSIKMAIVYKNPKGYICDEIRLTLLCLKRLSAIIEQGSLSKVVDASNDLSAYLDKRVRLLFQRSANAGNAVKGLTEKIKTVWVDGKKHLKSVVQSNDLQNCTQLKHCLNLMDNFIFDLFKRLYSSCVDLENQYSPTVYFGQIRKLIKDELKCYQEYLMVRNQQNITVNSYLKEFPGIVHFVFVKRPSLMNSTTQDLLFSPSLTSATCSSTHGKMFFSRLQKELCTFRNLASDHHVNREPSFWHRSGGGFIFVSEITFGQSRETLALKEIEKCWRENFSSISSVSPSIFCGNFFERITSRFMHNFEITTEYCLFELITVHFDGVPASVITKQRQDLLKRLLEF